MDDAFLEVIKRKNKTEKSRSSKKMKDIDNKEKSRLLINKKESDMIVIRKFERDIKRARIKLAILLKELKMEKN